MSPRFRPRRRAGERGAAVFVVVLVITMLMAIGLFAARSSRLTTTASGHARQMTQTLYLTDYTIHAAMAALSANLEPTINRMHSRPDPNCFGMAASERPSCVRFYAPSLEPQVMQGGKLIEPPAPGNAGSLGLKSLDAAFAIDLTSYSDGPAAPGYDLSPDGAAPFCFYSVVMTGTSRIRPTGSVTWDSSESSRAFLTVGPIRCH